MPVAPRAASGWPSERSFALYAPYLQQTRFAKCSWHEFVRPFLFGVLIGPAALASEHFGFGRDSRLTRPDEFKYCLDSRPFARSALFNMHWRATEEKLTTAKLGLIIPKRLIRSAVRRNTIKRVIREAFRLNRLRLPPGQLVFRLKAPVAPCSLTQTKQTVRTQVQDMLNHLAR